MKDYKLIYAIGLLGLIGVGYSLCKPFDADFIDEERLSTQKIPSAGASEKAAVQVVKLISETSTPEVTYANSSDDTISNHVSPEKSVSVSEYEQTNAGKVEKFARISDDQSWLIELSHDGTERSYERSVQLSDFIYQNEQLAVYSPQMECGKQLCGLLFQDVKAVQDADLIVSEVNRSSIRGPFMHHVMKPLANGQYKVRIMLPVSHDSSVIETLLPEFLSQQ